jgi:hypothetical protein
MSLIVAKTRARGGRFLDGPRSQGAKHSSSRNLPRSERHRKFKAVSIGELPKRVGGERPTRLFMNEVCCNVNPPAQGFTSWASMRSLRSFHSRGHACNTNVSWRLALRALGKKHAATMRPLRESGASASNLFR